MHSKVPGRGSADRVLLLAEKASIVRAETRASGERGESSGVIWTAVN